MYPLPVFPSLTLSIHPLSVRNMVLSYIQYLFLKDIQRKRH